jgi:hypothetical protein
MVPGFMQLLQDDQITLLKSGSYGILLLYVAQCYSQKQNTLIYNHNSINIETLISELFNNGSTSNRLNLDPEEKFFIQENVDFIKQLTNLNLTNSELAILSSIILFNPDLCNLYDHKFVYNYYQKFVELLRIDIENNRNHISSSSLEKQQMLQQILNLVSVNLKRLTQMHLELIKKFKIKYPSVEFPPLHRELFNVDYFVYYHQQQQSNQPISQLQNTKMDHIMNDNTNLNQNSSFNQISHTHNQLENIQTSIIKHEKHIIHENMNTHALTPSPSSCSSLSLTSSSHIQSSPSPSNNSNHLNSNNNYDHNIINYGYSVNKNKQTNQSTTNQCYKTDLRSSPSSTHIRSSNANNSLTLSYSNSMEYVQQLDEVLINNCNNNSKSSVNLSNNASPPDSISSSSSSISPTFTSISSTFSSISRNDQLYQSCNALPIGIE